MINDADMHYHDGSHRWVPPDSWRGDQQGWEELVRSHQAKHLADAERPRLRVVKNCRAAS